MGGGTRDESGAGAREGRREGRREGEERKKVRVLLSRQAHQRQFT